MDLQAWIPVTLATVYNFICEHQPEENGDDGGGDEDNPQLIGGGVDVDDDDAERNEGFDECDERRDQIAGEMWAQYSAEHMSHSSVTFTHYWPGSRCDIIGVSNGPADAADRMTIGLVMGQPTVKFKWPPVSWQWGWWANGAADSGFGGLMGQPTGQVEVTTSQLTVGLVG